MATKTLNKTKPPVPQGATTPMEWRKLCQLALVAAEKAVDRRALGLRAALENNHERRTLAAMNIMCDADVIREFSNLKT